MLNWKCEQCAWQSGKSGGQGSIEALNHAKSLNKQGTVKHSCFLFDTDADKPVLDPQGKMIKSLAKAQKLGIIPKSKEKTPKASSPETQNPGISDNPFSPSGLVTDVKSPQWLTIGTFRMPFEDWGYSSARNLLMVAETYSQAKVEYGFDAKVGDFCAQLCRAFRMLKGWDLIGAGYSEIEIGEGEE